MTIIETKPIQLIANSDKILTNGEAYSSAGGSVKLGCNSKIEDWYEITAEEYENILKQSIPDEEYEDAEE